MRYRIVIAIIVAATTLSSCRRAPPTPEVVPEPTGVRVTTLKDGGGRVDWSRQNFIAFDQAGADGYYDVFVMNPDGTGERCLTCGRSELPGHNGNPAWHPSGDYIVFQAQKTNAPANALSDYFANPGSGINNDLWVMNSAGTRFWRMTDVPLSIGGVLHPHFSPAGDRLLWAERISLTGGSVGGWALRLADFSVADGTPRLSNIRTFQPGQQKRFYESSSFSPDGRKILFSGDLEVGQDSTATDVYTLDIETSELTNLTNTLTQWDEHAQMSPAGNRIVWMSSMGVGGLNEPGRVRTDYWTMRPDGSAKTQLTFFNEPSHPEYIPDGALAADSSWSPDGTKLVAYVIRDVSTGSARTVVIELPSAQQQDGPEPAPGGPDDAAGEIGAGASSEPADGAVKAVRVAVGDGEASALRDWDVAIDRLEVAGKLERLRSVDDRLIPGRVHERFAQLHGGVPVLGGEFTRQRQNGRVVSVFGTYYTNLPLMASPTLGADAARDAVADSSRVLALTAPPGLMVVPTTGGRAALAYAVRAVTTSDIRLSLVEAHGAGVLAELSDEHTWPQEVGVSAPALRSRPPQTLAYDFRGLAETTVQAFGDPGARTWMESFRVAPGRTPEPAAVSVDTGLRVAVDHLAARLGMDLFSGELPMGVVHPDEASARRTPSGRLALFARGPFYVGRAMAVFPDPSTTASDGGFPVDVVAHTLGHAFVDLTSRLLPRGDAAGLGEGIARLVARGVVADVAGVDRAIGTAVSRGDPVLLQVFDTARQLGAVSTGRAPLERVFYRAAAFLMPSDATLSTARRATLQAARDLSTPAALTSGLTMAWDSAGVR